MDSRKGHYNLLNPDEESVFTRISLWEYGSPKNVLISSASVKTDYEVKETDCKYEDVVDWVIELLDAGIKKYVCNNDEQNILNFKKLIEDNREEITNGQKQFTIDNLIIKKDQLQKEIENIEKKINNLSKDKK